MIKCGLKRYCSTVVLREVDDCTTVLQYEQLLVKHTPNLDNMKIILQSMISRDLPITTPCITQFLKTYQSLKMEQSLQGLITSLKKNGIYDLYTNDHQDTIHQKQKKTNIVEENFKKEDIDKVDTGKIKQLLHSIQKGIPPTQKITTNDINLYLSKMIKHQNEFSFTKVLQIYKFAKENNLHSMRTFYILLIRCKVRFYLSRFNTIFKELIEFGYSPNDVTILMAIEMNADFNVKEQCFKIFEYYCNNNPRILSNFIIGKYISKISKFGDENELERVLQIIDDNKLNREPLTWNSMLSTYAHAGNKKKVGQTLTEMQKKNIKISIDDKLEIVNGFITSSRFNDASAVFQSIGEINSSKYNLTHLRLLINAPKSNDSKTTAEREQIIESLLKNGSLFRMHASERFYYHFQRLLQTGNNQLMEKELTTFLNLKQKPNPAHILALLFRSFDPPVPFFIWKAFKDKRLFQHHDICNFILEQLLEAREYTKAAEYQKYCALKGGFEANSYSEKVQQLLKQVENKE